ncbi:hypothetical protein BIV57_10260 [Mangrovactinospora gilvigrisea]|uniref:Heavy metal-binding domain-containing protein n=1 Tax=Mangrovactinospora gilvigrisea TaxID=1428644 RepID=A0A1J7CD33_9ACTN|nr:heavy metal-binding domain-containing protein [Mangrovactinospora gilvigrisea]OIV37578.1 hypothetical protein BIV57_10260 [Mangrovactinospora gilvigrisea]
MTSEWGGQGLPPAAAARMAEVQKSGTWGSALSTGEFAAIRSVGFEPVGQVMGSAVFNIGRSGRYWGYHDCTYRGGVFSGGDAPVALSGRGGPSAPLVQVLLEARHRALERMRAEVLALGGAGVVAAQLTVAPFAASPQALEFQVIGTAVRASVGAAPVRRPFTSHVGGQAFAKLVGAGWIPVDLLFGLSIGVRHDNWATRSQNRAFASNQEVEGWTRLVNEVRHDARQQLYQQASATGGDGVVLDDFDLRVWEEACFRNRMTNNESDKHDRIAEASMVGTAIAAFRTSAAPRSTLSIMPLKLKSQTR